MMSLSQRVNSVVIPVLVLLVVISTGCGGGKPAVTVAAPTASGGSTSVVAGAGTVTISTSLTNDSASKGVTWSLTPATGCGTLASAGATSAAYTPPAESALNADCTATVTATSVADSTKASTLALTIHAVAVSIPSIQSAGEFIPSGSSTPLALTAGIANDNSGSGLTWSLSGPAPVIARGRMSRARANDSALTPSTTCGSLSATTGTSVTYTPPAAGYCTATITVAATANSSVSRSFTVTSQETVTAGITAANKVYDTTTTEPLSGVTCTLTPAPANVTCAPAAASFASANVANGITVTATGIALSGSAASNFVLSSTTATATANITTATPTLALNCPTVTYDAATHTCTGTATGVGGATVSGTFSMNPATLTNATTGTTVTGTFTSSNANYVTGGTATGTLIINKATSTPTVTAANKVFDGNATESLANVACNPHVLTADQANVTCAGTAANFSQSSVGTGLTVTVTGISLSGSAASNYSLSSTTATTTASITGIAVAPVITAADKAYDGTATELNTTCTTNPVVANLTCAAAAATFSQSNVGTGLTVTATGITLGGSAAPNYSLSATSATATANITQATPTLVLTCPTITYDASAHACTAAATGVGGATVSGSFSLNPPTITNATTGTTVTGTFTSSNANYVTGGTATGTLIINKATVTATVTAASKVYDGTTTELLSDVTCDPHVLTADQANVTCAGTAANFSQAGAGSGLTVTVTGISLSGSAASNYALASTTATTSAGIARQAVGAVITAADKVYDGTNVEPAGNLTCATTPQVANMTCTAAGGTFSQANAGTGLVVTVYGITLGGSAAVNYMLPSSSSTAQASITRATPTLALTCPTVTYDATAHACTATATGVGGATVPGSFSLNPATITAATTGTTVTGTFTTSSLNYVSGGTASGTLIINPATVTATVTAGNKVFDGTTTEPLNSVVCNPHVLTADQANVTCAGTAANFSQSAVGNGLTVTVTGISLSGSAAANYALSATSATTTANITNLAVAPVITAANKTYDGTNNEPLGNLTCATNPVVANLTCSAAAATFSQANVGTGLTVTATGITLGGSAASNYSLSTNTATATANINQATPSLALTCPTLTYDATAHACTTSATGVGGATVAGSFSLNPATITGATTGTTVTGTFTSSDANYVSGGTASGTLIINKATATATVTAGNKVFDGTTTEPLGSVTCNPHVLAADQAIVTCAGTAASFSQSAVGTGLTVTVTGISLSGATASNYALTSTTATTTASITNLAVAPVITAANKTYDGTTNEPQANITCTTNPVVANLTCSPAAASFSQSNVGTGLTVTATGITLGGSAAPNYSLSTSTATATANINQATPVLALACGSVLYDGNAHTCPTGTATGVGGISISGSWSFTYNGSSTPPSAKGSYTVVGTFTSSDPNYASGGTATSLFAITAVPSAINVDAGSSQQAQQAVVNTAFGKPLAVVVLDNSSAPVSGITVNFNATCSGACATLSSSTAVTNGSGIAQITATANTVANANSYTVVASVAGYPSLTFTFNLTNTPGTPVISVMGGSNQTATVNSAFNLPLQVLVQDSYGNPINGATVNYSAPTTSTPSAVLSSGSATTGSNGQASVTATADLVAGSYTVTASTSGASSSASFNLTNLAGAPFSVSPMSGSGQSTDVSTSFTNPLVVQVKDQYNNGVSGITVNFSAPGSGASASLSSTSAVTDSNGQASVNATANGTSGGYHVDATVSGVSNPAVFGLTNLATGFNISGWVQLGTGLGQGNVTLTLTQGSTVVGHTSTVQSDVNCPNPGNSGCFTFTGIPNGTYTITPTLDGTNWPGATALFSPAHIASLSVNNADVPNLNFQMTVGYTVTGTVANGSGSGKTGTIYVGLVSNTATCDNGPCYGTAIPLANQQSSGGTSFSISGVPPGTYTAEAWLDNVGLGVKNGSDPTTSSSVTVPVPTGQNPSLTVVDHANSFTGQSGPTISALSPVDGGVVLQLTPVYPVGCDRKTTVCIEMPPRYHVQWSTSASFTSIAGETVTTLRAIGGDEPYVLTSKNSSLAGLTNTAILYFRVRGENIAGTNFTNWTTTSSPVTIGPLTPSNPVTMSGHVIYTGSINTGPLYVGCFDQNTGNVYAQTFVTATFPQAYSVQVPTGANCYIFAILDNNNNGVIDIGDSSNTGDNSASLVITAAVANLDLTLSGTNSTITATTNRSRLQGNGTSNDTYSIEFRLVGGLKLPVSAQLSAESAANLLDPVDIAPAGPYEHAGRFVYDSPVFGTLSGGEQYGFSVQYSDALTPEVVTATVAAPLSSFAQNPTLVTTGSATVTKPTFQWSAPASAPAGYTYKFILSDQNFNWIWKIPSDNSNTYGLPSSVTSLAWPTNCSSYTDPVGDSNPPSLCSAGLTSGTTYYWTISVQDTNGNTAQLTANSYTP